MKRFRVLLRDGIRHLTAATTDAAKIRLVLCLGDAQPSPSHEVMTKKNRYCSNFKNIWKNSVQKNVFVVK